MKKLFTPLFVLSGLACLAQPTITSSTAGGIGDDFSYDYISTEDFDPGASGADVTWDFSGLVTTGGSENAFTLIDPATTGMAAEFPGANIANEDGTGNYGFFKITSTEYTLYGVATPATEIYYSDPEELYVYPLTMGTTNSDDLYAEYFSGVDIIRSGSNEMTADGYGTLILPSGTYTNVLRVKLEQNYSDEAVGFPITYVYDFDLYYWFKEGVKGSLFHYFYLDINTGGFPTISES